MKRFLRNALRASGFDIVRHQSPAQPKRPFPDVSDEDLAVLHRVAGYTMTSAERQLSLIQAVRYIIRRGIEGSFVECGVWRGGSSMAVALTLMEEKRTDCDLYLYDTFEGMTSPTPIDRALDGTTAQAQLDCDVEKTSVWCIADVGDVQQNMSSTGYPAERVHYVKGPVEATIPEHSPSGKIAMLRLDTDWYESTRHELVHLFPLLAEGGVMIIDDYGHWEGARKAVDEYLRNLGRYFYMHRIDYTGRVLVKL